MKDRLLYANARAKAKEANLLSQERLTRMLDQTDIAAATRILNEAGYGGGAVGVTPDDFAIVLNKEEELLYAFINEVYPAGVGFECFFIQMDYLNLKAQVKSAFTGDKPAFFAQYGLYKLETIAAIALGGAEGSSFMRDGIAEIEKYCDKNPVNPRIIDTALDRAMFKEILHRLTTADRYVKQYFTMLTDLTNVASVVRTAAVKGDREFYLNLFIEGGTLPREGLTATLDNPKEGLAKLLTGTPYAAFAARLDSGLVDFDRERDNILLAIFKQNSFDMFSAAPALGYYLAKVSELKTLRIVLTSIKNGLKKESILKRVRSNYV